MCKNIFLAHPSVAEDNKDIMIFIANYLVKHEIMDGEQFELCFTEGVTEETLDAVTERKKKANQIENDNRKKELEEKKASAKKNKKSEDDELVPTFEDNGENNDNGDDTDDTDDTDVFSDDILNS